MQYPVSEEPCLEGVGSGLLCILSCGSPFWSVTSDKSAGNSAELAAAGVLQSDPASNGFNAPSVLWDSLGMAFAFFAMALVHDVVMKLQGLDLILILIFP